MGGFEGNERWLIFSGSLNNFSETELWRAAPQGPILIHGGGNFGTTWPKHEALRLKLLRAFPGRSIVQLPQSLYYDDDLRIREMAEAIREPGAFTLLVRDAPSFAFAQRHFDCDVRLCPDAVLYLGRFQRAAPTADILELLRTDHERVRYAAPIPPGVRWDEHTSA